MVEVKRFTIGEIAARADISTATLRFYEHVGLIRSERNPAGHRRYHADVLRRVAFVRAAQQVGLSLDEIGRALASLPDERTPNADDWAALARSWRPRLDAQIALLHRLRDRLDGCIGCGCLSLDSCALWNPDDVVGHEGRGSRYLLHGDRPRRPPRP